MEMSKLILISFTLVWCLGGVVQGFTYDDKEVETEEGKSAMFEKWRSHHNLEGARDRKKQYENFKATLEHVHSTNKANLGYTLEMNRFAGTSKEELRSMRTGFKGARKNPGGGQKFMKLFGGQPGFRYSDVTDLPPSFDWRPTGAISRVKNQDQCASCYAFAAVDAVEGMHFVETGELIEVSPQEIVDCADPIMGCEGGWMTTTYEYIEKNGGITTEKNYPYNGVVNPCNVKKEHDVAIKVGGHENIPTHNEENLMKALINQPISVSVKCEDDLFYYKEGVLSSPCGTDPDHAVLMVGYDTTPEGTPYWLLKNSWGDSWGEKGYFKTLRGVPGEGYCGITISGCYPTPDKTNTPHPDNEPKVHGKLKPRSRDL